MASPQGFPQYATPFVDKNGRITQSWMQLLISLWQRTGAGQGDTINLTGEVKAYAGTSVPAGYLLCDGSPVNRQTYAALFSVIGTTWGAGDGVSTFNLPNLIDRFPKGASSPGATGGQNGVVIGVNNLPAHTHAVNDPGHIHGTADPQHHHSALDPANNVTAGAAAGGVTAGGLTGDAFTGIAIVNAVTGITVDPTGSGDPLQFSPPFVAMLFIIKT